MIKNGTMLGVSSLRNRKTLPSTSTVGAGIVGEVNLVNFYNDGNKGTGTAQVRWGGGGQGRDGSGDDKVCLLPTMAQSARAPRRCGGPWQDGLQHLQLCQGGRGGVMYGKEDRECPGF